jgi:hypothetical protein
MRTFACQQLMMLQLNCSAVYVGMVVTCGGQLYLNSVLLLNAPVVVLHTICRQWLEEKARNRSLEEQLQNNAVYEVEVKTGKMKVCERDMMQPCAEDTKDGTRSSSPAVQGRAGRAWDVLGLIVRQAAF